MRLFVRILALTTFGAYLAVSAWRSIFQVLLETPSFDVPHLDAGAGDNGLLAQAFLGFIAMCSCFAWCLTAPRWRLRALAAILTLMAPAIFYFTAQGLQRFAQGFSEERFAELQALHEKGVVLNASDIVAKLGEPLIVDRADRLPDGQVRWLYSYMPSCGFGWDKKYIWVGPDGHVTQIFTLKEP